MQRENYARVKELFLAAMERQPDQRQQFLEAACNGDAVLRSNVEALLADGDASRSDLLSAGQGNKHSRGLSGIPERIGRYKIVSVEGEGGMGVVYRAEQIEPIRRVVALKLIKLGMDTKEVLARFETERQALALMNHPNVAKVLDGGTTEQGRPYFVMEFVQGDPITDYCDAHRLSPKQRLLLFQDVCHAVQHAHQKGIIHRDLKPSNVLVATEDDQPVVKVIDFGVAKATQQRLTEQTLFTQQGQMIGTPRYMSPEQAGLSQTDIDTRTDIYSLGVLLYELLVGARPFGDHELRAAGLAEMQRIIREVDPPRPSTRLSSLGGELSAIADSRGTEPQTLLRILRGDIDWIVMKCLEKDRDRRYANAADLADDLARYLDSRPIRARPPSTAYQVRKLVSRHRLAVGAATFFVLVLVSSTIVVTSFWLRSESFRRQADDHWRSLLTQQEERAAAEMLAAQAKGEAEKSAQISAERIRFARGIHNFLVEVFRAGGSSASGRADVTLREAFNKGLRDPNVLGHFKDLPELEFKVHQVIGFLLNDWGDFEAAEAHLLRSIEIQRQLSDVSKYEQAQNINLLAGVYFDRREFEKAEPLYLEVLELAPEFAVGDKRWILGTALNDVGATLIRKGEAGRAVEYFQGAEQIYREEFGPVDWRTLQATFNLANCLEDLGETQEALNWHEEILALRRQHPDQASFVARSLERIADIYLEHARPVEAEPRLREAAEMNRKVLGAEHPHYARTLTKLARVLIAFEQFVEAESLAREAHSICRAKLKPDAPDLRDAVLILCDVLERQGKSEEARQYQAELVGQGL